MAENYSGYGYYRFDSIAKDTKGWKLYTNAQLPDNDERQLRLVFRPKMGSLIF